MQHNLFQSNQNSQKSKIRELIDDNAKENMFSILAWKLMDGVNIEGKWLKIIKNNSPVSVDDTAIYDVDFAITENQDVIGYLDVERKVSWNATPWPYPKTNIAKYPMIHWIKGSFTGRETNKIQSFRKKPIMSFWVGVSADYQRCQIAPAKNIFDYGIDAVQPTRYSPTPLPIYELSNEHCFYCQTADEFTSTIIGWYRDVYLAN